ncbi:MAG: 30S ribosomal protein S12 methylthiotransferase RimO, partial [Porphyromonadaceae bacterium]|nr:30S ribosomal protein S12 methylthiotransferase RimO [Porphyromonadaceae bacterium]
MVKNRIDVITLGCSKNLVDSESLMRQFRVAGYDVYADAPEVKGEIVVINTCGFIGDAKEESIQMILSCAQAKSRHKIGRLYVMGCLSQRYREELAQEIPEVDKFYGKFDYPALLTDLGKAYREEYRLERELTTPSHYAYLKIAEGCDRLCAYCAIPLITGRYVSRPMEDILAETERLVSRGVKEFQVIAQDLTYYGKDLYGRFCIAELIDRMAAIPGVEWIRLHYAYPDRFPMDLLPVMAQRKNVCRYLDIALQHSSDSVLARMRRRVTRAETEALLARIREEVPGIHLRTTLMVGFPGESEADFEDLLQFVRHMRFERMGAFAYSEEEGTYSAAHYKDDVPDAVKRQRLD